MNPLESAPLAANDPMMIALLAYIRQERRGEPRAPGKHEHTSRNDVAWP